MPQQQQAVTQPDETSQRQFYSEALKGSAPQYNPAPDRAMRAAAKWTPPGAAADAMGMLGGPSIAQNVREGHYLPAAMQAAAVGVPAGVQGGRLARDLPA